MRRAAVVAAVGLTAGFGVGLGIQKSGVQARCWSSTTHLKYPPSSNYPDLTQHNNVMAKVLTPGVRKNDAYEMQYEYEIQ